MPKASTSKKNKEKGQARGNKTHFDAKAYNSE
jgi:hypothetical protein